MVRQQKPLLNGMLKFGASAGMILLLSLLAAPSFAQDSADDKKAWALAEVAVNAQNAEEYPTAQKKWQQLLDTYPNAEATRSAWYNLANC